MSCARRFWSKDGSFLLVNFLGRREDQWTDQILGRYARRSTWTNLPKSNRSSLEDLADRTQQYRVIQKRLPAAQFPSLIRRIKALYPSLSTLHTCSWKNNDSFWNDGATRSHLPEAGTIQGSKSIASESLGHLVEDWEKTRGELPKSKQLQQTGRIMC